MSSSAPLKSAAPPVRSIERLSSLLGIMSAQIDAAVQETDTPVAALVETAHAMSSATQTLAKGLFDFSGNPARVFQDLMVLHDNMHARSIKAASAIQFHDRLVQSLTHVSTSLKYISDFISTPGAKSNDDWKALGDRIRALLSMEYERALYDSLSGEATTDSSDKKGSAGTVELF